MSIELYILILLALIVCSKWIIFILMCPLLIVSRIRKEKAWKGSEKRPNATADKSEDPKAAVTGPKSSPRESIMHKILKTPQYYFFGYNRYIDFQVGLIPSHTIRNFIYRKIFGVRLSKMAIIYWGAEIRGHYKLKIGRGTIIGDHAVLDARNGIEIGDNVNFSSEVHIWTEQHDHRDPYFGCANSADFKVTIGDRVWVGPGVTILHSVNIGEGAVIAAGAVVTKDVEPFAIMAGIPAKKIGERNRNLKYVLDGAPAPFY